MNTQTLPIVSKSPGYYVRKRLITNIPAMFGMVVISLSVLVAVAGYLIMPDQTPNANDGAVQIQKKLPGFQVDMLKIRKSVDIDKVSFFSKMFFGQENEFIVTPITKWEFKGEGVEFEFRETGKPLFSKYMDLITIVRPVFTGQSAKSIFPSGKNYSFENGIYQYLDIHEQMVSVSIDQLQEEFKSNHIERRKYKLGTDKAGRDILSRLFFGSRISLGIGLVSVLISLLLGGMLGAIAGYFGGWLDNVVQWLMTVVWSIPSIMLVIAISLALQSKGVWVAFVAVGLTTWVEIARVIRGQVMAIKEKTFVEAARALGFRNLKIIISHILPNLIGPIIVIATSNFASAILVEAGLSFLGMGVQPPMPSWGMMVNEGFHAIGTKDSWHLVVFPSLAISIIVLAFNLFGNGLRDAYDPQSAGKI